MSHPTSENRTIDFNVNHFVHVKLTDRGRQIHREDYDVSAEHIRSRGGKPDEYRAPVEDSEGWSRWQLWTLMNLFGNHIAMGLPLAFETSIRIDMTTP